MKNRKLKINTSHGIIQTPAFFPDATYGAIKSVGWNDLLSTNTHQVVTTTLHLEQKIGSEYIAKMGGLHKFFNWEYPILTDSGGYQVFTLIYRQPNSQNAITDAGCTFRDFETGDFKFLSPEISQIIQYRLKSDIVTVLDVPLQNEASTSELLQAIRRNTEWALRSKKKFLELHNLSEEDFYNPDIKRPLIGAVVQGGNNKDLRRQSAEELVEIGFDLYNFGGPPIHNQKYWRDDVDKGFNHDMLEYVARLLPKDKVLYAMGVGSPSDIEFSHSVGWDIFDTVLPTRNARHGYLYVSEGQGDTDFRSYSVVHIKNEMYKYDEKPVDEKCDCECCRTVSRAYLRYLIKMQESIGFRLASIHNLSFYQKVMDGLC